MLIAARRIKKSVLTDVLSWFDFASCSQDSH
jgi:hypothetical protein